MRGCRLRDCGAPDCPTCMGAEAARLYREQQACDHEDHDQGICLACGADITDTLSWQRTRTLPIPHKTDNLMSKTVNPWNPGTNPPTLPLTVIGVVGNRPVLVWYSTRTGCWHDNPAAFDSIPVEWWQYLPDCVLIADAAQGPNPKHTKQTK
jgi:hypothetical protein